MYIGSGISGMESEKKHPSDKGKGAKNGSAESTGLKGSGSAFLRKMFSKDRHETYTPFYHEQKSNVSMQYLMDQEQFHTNNYLLGASQIIKPWIAFSYLNEIRKQCIDYLFYVLFPSSNKRKPRFSSGYVGGFITGADPDGGTGYVEQYYLEETEEASFFTQGTVECGDSREITFNLNLNMSKSFQENYERTTYFKMPEIGRFYDPLVVHLNVSIMELQDQNFYIDFLGRKLCEKEAVRQIDR